MELQPLTSAKGLSFNYEDSEGYKVWEKNEKEGRGDSTVAIHDDGSISGAVGTLFKKSQYFTVNDDCTEVPNTNLERCSGKYAKVIL